MSDATPRVRDASDSGDEPVEPGGASGQAMDEPMEADHERVGAEDGRTGSASRPLDVTSWAFWRKRIGRALIVGALALTATQLLPALPQDQVVEVVAPEGLTLGDVELTYFEEGDTSALAGTRLRPSSPTRRLPHTIRLPEGRYLVQVSAQGSTSDGAMAPLGARRTLHLRGSTARIHLKRKALRP